MAILPKYSVIVPVYNREATLARCIDSLLSEPREDVQILLVDDGSTDKSGVIAREYADAHSVVQYFYKENGGVSSARNLGLDLASGQYVSFVDCDDYVSEDYFSILDKATTYSQGDMVVFQKSGFGGNSPDETAWFHNLSKLTSYVEMMEYLLACRIMMQPVNKCFRNAIIQREKLRFTEGLHIGEDFVFCMAYAMCCKHIQIEPAVLYFYDISDSNSLSRKYRPNLCDDMNTVYHMVESSLHSSQLSTSEKERLLKVVDYLYVKIACSCVAEEFKIGHFGYMRYRSIFADTCSRFRKPISIGYFSTLHLCLRLLLTMKIYYPFYLVAYLVKGRKYLQ